MQDHHLALRYYNLAQTYSNGTMPEAWLPITVASFPLRLRKRISKNFARIWLFKSLPSWMHVLAWSTAIGLAVLLAVLVSGRHRGMARRQVNHEHQD